MLVFICLILLYLLISAVFAVIPIFALVKIYKVVITKMIEMRKEQMELYKSLPTEERRHRELIDAIKMWR